MPDTKRAWISILIAAAIIVAIAALTTLVGSTALFFYRHSSAEFVSSESAADQLARTRSRFGGKRPLIDFNVRDEPVLHREDAPSAAVHQLTTLFILAYDTRARKLVRVNIPFWLLRLAPTRPVRFLDDTIAFDPARAHLTIDDLERHGPGPVLDRREPEGAEVLVWTE